MNLELRLHNRKYVELISLSSAVTSVPSCSKGPISILNFQQYNHFYRLAACFGEHTVYCTNSDANQESRCLETI